MWEELRTRYENRSGALNIIDDLEALVRKSKDLPNGFPLGDYSLELTRLILSDIGYTIRYNERITNEDGTFSLFLVITENKVPEEEWDKVADRYRTHPQTDDIIGILRRVQKEYNIIPRSFYVPNNVDLELLKSILLDIGYVVVSTKLRKPAKCSTYSFLIRTSKKTLSL